MTLVGAARPSATRVGMPSRRLNRRNRRRVITKLVLSPVMLVVAAGVSLPFYYIVVKNFEPPSRAQPLPWRCLLHLHTELQERIQFRTTVAELRQ